MDIWENAKTEDLPESLRNLEELIGLEAIAAIYRAGLAKRLYIPKKVSGDHRIALAIGVEKLEILSFEFGGLWIDFPKCSELSKRVRDEAIRNCLRMARSKGRSNMRAVFETAREFGLSAETIKKVARVA